MKYTVSIDFRKGPSFSCDVEAADALRAESKAITTARMNGFDMMVKRVQTSEVSV